MFVIQSARFALNSSAAGLLSVGILGGTIFCLTYRRATIPAEDAPADVTEPDSGPDESAR